MSARFGVVSAFEGLLTPVRLRSAFRSCLHARGRLAGPPGRSLSRALRPVARDPAPRRPSSFTGPLHQPRTGLTTGTDEMYLRPSSPFARRLVAQRLPAGHRQRRDHRHRSRAAGTDDPRQRRSAPTSVAPRAAPTPLVCTRRSALPLEPCERSYCLEAVAPHHSRNELVQDERGNGYRQEDCEDRPIFLEHQAPSDEVALRESNPRHARREPDGQKRPEGQPKQKSLALQSEEVHRQVQQDQTFPSRKKMCPNHPRERRGGSWRTFIRASIGRP